MKTLRLLEVSPTMSDEELERALNVANSVCLNTNSAFYLTVQGYDRDPRELWEVPEVLELFDRLVDMGFMTVLEVNAGEGMIPQAIGSYQLWTIHKRLVSGRTIAMTRDRLNEFVDALNASNAVVDEKYPREAQ